MHVLHLSCQRGWRGGERQVWLLARGITGRGLVQTVAAPAGSALERRGTGIDVERLPLHRRHALHPLNLLRVIAWLRRHPATIVHAHTSPTLTLAAMARRAAPVKGVVHTRRVAFPVRPSRKYRTAADRYVAISRAVADALLASGLDQERLTVIPSAVDLEPVDAATPTPELEPGGPVVGCVAAMTAEKGLETLVAAWPLVVSAHPDARLVLLGDGPLRSSLETGAPPRVVFAGHRDDVPAWLKLFTIYAQPSLAEGLGTAVLDAMACRLPVVASRTGGLPETVVHGETGLLAPPGDAGALAAALLDLLAAPQRAAAMGEAGRRRVEQRFTVAAMVEAYVGLYDLLDRQA